MLRLVVGFVSHAREEDPVVLYLGHSNSKAIEVIGANKDNEKFVGLGITEIPIMRKARVSPHVAAMMDRSAGVSTVTSEETAPGDDDGLEQQTVEWLETEASENGIDVTGCKLKADYVERIREFRALESQTVAQLKDQAEAEQVEVETPGFFRSAKKADLINAILGKRRTANQPPESTGGGPSL